MNTKEKGDIGERVACRFLEKRGFTVVEQNYRKKWGEIDVIAKKQDVLAFIEVKSVEVKDIIHSTSVNGSKSGYRPEENVHSAKRRRLRRTIQTFLAERRYSIETNFNFHVITVFLNFNTRRAHVLFIEDVIL